MTPEQEAKLLKEFAKINAKRARVRRDHRMGVYDCGDAWNMEGVGRHILVLSYNNYREH